MRGGELKKRTWADGRPQILRQLLVLIATMGHSAVPQIHKHTHTHRERVRGEYIRRRNKRYFMYMPYINVTLLWQTVSVNTQSMYQCVINNKLLAIYQAMQPRQQQQQSVLLQS